MDKTLILARLKYFYTKHKRMPTYGEMCRLLGYRSKGAVRYVVQKLIQEGMLEKDRQGKLVPKKLLSLPMLGIIKAGYPIPAQVQEDNYLNLHLLFDKMSHASYALKVSGDSMIGEGIHEGDMVIVDKSRQPKNGDIVAACVDGEWTVKYFRKDGQEVSLLPANKKYPLIQPKESLEIGGVVIHVLRSYR